MELFLVVLKNFFYRKIRKCFWFDKKMSYFIDGLTSFSNRTQLFLLSCLQEEAVKALMKYGVGSCGPRGFYGTMGKFVACSHLREKRTCFVISLLIFRHGNCQGLQI